MNQHSMITNDLNSLGDAIHEYSQEQGRYQFYQRSVARQKLQQESIIAKRVRLALIRRLSKPHVLYLYV